jgi:general secretion pathway protein K
MALLMVLTCVAVLTAVVVEFAYDTRVDATLAANARDELRAHYMARSATNLARLVLHFQGQLDRQSQQIQQAIGAATGGAAAGMAVPKIQLWKLLPVESGTINMFVGAIAGAPPEDVPLAPTDPRPGEMVPAAGLQSFGTFDGGFSASIEDEESKLNLNRLARGLDTASAATAMHMMLLWKDPRWDFLFNEDNLHRERFTREELVAHLRDWGDANEAGATIDRLTGKLVDGVSDEVGPYTDYRPDYKPKNAPFDTVSEVYQVAGWGDRLMSAFGDRLTVYPDINSPLNINTDDELQQYVNILMAAENPDLPALQDPAVIQVILEELQLIRMFGGAIPMTVQQFASVLVGAGIPVKPEIQHSGGGQLLGNTSQTFRIEAVGQAGDVTRRITTVVKMDDQLGKLLYWRED